MTWIISHLILWLLWKIPAWMEQYSRVGRRNIPLYFTGDIANPIAFSLLVYAWQLSINWLFTGLAAIASVLIVRWLHCYWSRYALESESPVSLYKTDGTMTLSGLVHLVYVWVVLSVTLSYITRALHRVHEQVDNIPGLSIFTIGIAAYALAVIIDRRRGLV